MDFRPSWRICRPRSRSWSLHKQSGVRGSWQSSGAASERRACPASRSFMTYSETGKTPQCVAHILLQSRAVCRQDAVFHINVRVKNEIHFPRKLQSCEVIVVSALSSCLLNWHVRDTSSRTLRHNPPEEEVNPSSHTWSGCFRKNLYCGKMFRNSFNKRSLHVTI